MQMDIAKIHASLLEKGEEAARTKARARSLDRMRKQIKARAKLWAINRGNTAAKAEEMALIDDDYIAACYEAETAEEEAGLAAVAYEAAQAWLDVWRTLESTKRAEMQLR